MHVSVKKPSTHEVEPENVVEDKKKKKGKGKEGKKKGKKKKGAPAETANENGETSAIERVGRLVSINKSFNIDPIKFRVLTPVESIWQSNYFLRS